MLSGIGPVNLFRERYLIFNTDNRMNIWIYKIKKYLANIPLTYNRRSDCRPFRFEGMVPSRSLLERSLIRRDTYPGRYKKLSVNIIDRFNSILYQWNFYQLWCRKGLSEVFYISRILMIDIPSEILRSFFFYNLQVILEKKFIISMPLYYINNW